MARSTFGNSVLFNILKWFLSVDKNLMLLVFMLCKCVIFFKSVLNVDVMLCMWDENLLIEVVCFVVNRFSTFNIMFMFGSESCVIKFDKLLCCVCYRWIFISGFLFVFVYFFVIMFLFLFFVFVVDIIAYYLIVVVLSWRMKVSFLYVLVGLML